jgi:hypothetical protein
MGNQESTIVDDKYIIRKKKNSSDKNINNNNQNTNNIDKNNNYNQNSNYNNNQNNNYNQSNNFNSNQNNNYNKNKNNNYNSNQNNNYNNNNLNYNNNQNNYNQNNNKNNLNYNNNNKILEKHQSNSAIIERNIISDLYSNNNHNKIFDYPSNSNNDLVIPKKNIDNIKFTPYNFNDEIDKFKNSIDNERVEFENSEKERRKQFEKNENEKRDFLNNEIKKFELNYNPWEILDLKYNDYNISNITKAYRKKALKYHPDKAGDKYIDKFQLITQSYIYLLKKAEENNYLEEKINKNVVNVDYEDDINDGVENIYVDKNKFDVNQFNKIFDKYKVPSTFDKGYSNLMKQELPKNEDTIFGKNFNKDIFNSHFDNIKKNKISDQLIEYNEPMALESSLGNLNLTQLGMDDINDFGAVNSNGLSYTDYKKAHVDETLLIDVNKVKYKTYNSIDQLESDRSKLSYTPNVEDKQRYEYMERKRLDDDNIRIQKQKDYDDMMNNHYNKLNRKLIIHK